MVTLNLRDDCVARTATNFRRGMTDKRFLELEITAWLVSPERKRQLAGEMYYDGDQAVLRRRRMALNDEGQPVELKHLPNNRLVNNQYSKMVDQKTNYSFGRPFSFDTENKQYAEALNAVLGSRFRRMLRAVGEGAWIGGKSWLYPYYEGGELAFKRFPADEVLPFWADADHTILDAAVHVYMVLEYDEAEQAKDVVKVEVMHGGGVDCFIRKDDGTLVPDDYAQSGSYITETDPATGEAKPYNWERIPLVCFKSSHHELPLLSRVKCLQDAYNDVLSNFANQMEEDINVVIQAVMNAGLVVANIALGIWNALGAVCSNIGTAFHNVIANVQSWFYGLLSTALTVVAGICEALNKLPFVEFDYSGITSKADEYAAKSAAAADSKEEYTSIADAFSEGFGTFDAFSEGWASDAFTAGASWGDGVADAVGGFFDGFSYEPGTIADFADQGFDSFMMDSLGNDVGDIADNTGGMAHAMEVSGEELKYLRDIAERDTINRFTTAEVKIDMTGMTNKIDSNMDLDGVIRELTDGFSEALVTAAEGVHE